ncbi:MAG: pyrroline-5-carboxylate reductase family protein, partial [Anaerovoracaceae bacterium]
IMPNTPAMVGEAMIAVCRNENVNPENFDFIMDMFNSVGKAQEIEENLMDCVIGVSGSSPAYTYMYIEALVQAAVENGMTYDKAKVFAAQAVIGAAKMALESSESLEQLRINVCSPNGTTIEAVNKLFENGFMDKVKEGFQAAVDRSIEMTEEKK